MAPPFPRPSAAFVPVFDSGPRVASPKWRVLVSSDISEIDVFGLVSVLRSETFVGTGRVFWRPIQASHVVGSLEAIAGETVLRPRTLVRALARSPFYVLHLSLALEGLIARDRARGILGGAFDALS